MTPSIAARPTPPVDHWITRYVISRSPFAPTGHTGTRNGARNSRRYRPVDCDDEWTAGCVRRRLRMSRQEQRPVRTSSKQRQFVDRAAKVLEAGPREIQEMFSRVQRPSIRVNPLVGDPAASEASINAEWELE